MSVGNTSLDHVVECSAIQCQECIKTLREVAARLNAADKMADALREAKLLIAGFPFKNKLDNALLARIDAVLGGREETKEVSRGD